MASASDGQAASDARRNQACFSNSTMICVEVDGILVRELGNVLERADSTAGGERPGLLGLKPTTL